MQASEQSQGLTLPGCVGGHRQAAVCELVLDKSSTANGGCRQGQPHKCGAQGQVGDKVTGVGAALVVQGLASVVIRGLLCQGGKGEPDMRESVRAVLLCVLHACGCSSPNHNVKVRLCIGCAAQVG